MQEYVIVFQSLVITLVRRVNDAVWCLRREGAEQQCRKRGGSRRDGGVTPLKVKHLYYYINSGRFAFTTRSLSTLKSALPASASIKLM